MTDPSSASVAALERQFPYRAQINVTFPARDQAHAAEIVEAMTDALEPWGFFELASAECMDEADVITDSPLAEAIGRA